MKGSEILQLIILLLVIADFFWEQWLKYLNAKRLDAPIPGEVRDIYEPEEYRRSLEYNRANYRFSCIRAWFSFVLLILMLAFGGFGYLDAWVRTLTDNPYQQALLFFGILFGVSFLLSLPFDYYDTFVIEEKFGFNRSRLKTFIADQIKSFLLTILLGGGILFLVQMFYLQTGKSFWWIAWLTVSVILLIINLLYSDLIVPLFNRQMPLPEGELRDRIFKTAKKAGFSLKDIYVIDGSKRSTKANAYFSGFGPRKRIVLYDTLIDQLTTEEILAVLAHEIGHYKHKHILRQMLLTVALTGVSFYLFSLVIDNSSVAEALGTNHPSFHIGLVAFALLYQPFSRLTGWLLNRLSRKYEFQADRFAAGMQLSGDLISALKKMAAKHLSNLTPHPLYVEVHYSHLPLHERIKNLSNEK